jgi:hypothetical protein
MPAEVAAEFHHRAMAIIGAALRNDPEGCAELVGDDAEELLPFAVGILLDVLDRLGYTRMMQQELDAWFADRLAG